jgi:hypothetical protein
MKTAGSLAAVALVLVTVLPRTSRAQQAPVHGPAALNVPHPIPPPASTAAVPPRDLYQQLTPPATPTVIYPVPGYVYGPFPYYSPYGAYSMPDGSGNLFHKVPPEKVPGTFSAKGALRLESSPGSAQVFVDGLYVGVVEDFGLSGRALDLDEGAHRVELRAAGYAVVNVDVRIAARQTTRYRGDLQRLSPAPAASVPPAPPAVPRTTYVIPNCYAGDRPPSHVLRSGCDIAKMIVRKP